MATVHADIARALIEMLETGSCDAVLAVLAPGAQLWHNSDHLDTDMAAGVRAVDGLHALVEGVRIDVAEEEDLPGGFLQRSTIRGRVRSTGNGLAAHQAVRVWVADGLITRVEEYVDPTFLSQLGVGT